MADEDDEVADGNEEVSEVWDEEDEDMGEDVVNPGWVPPLGGIGRIFALLQQPVNLEGLFAHGGGDGIHEQRHDDSDTPWGDDDAGDGEEDEEQDSDDDGWVPPVSGVHGWAPVPVSLEDILGVDEFADYDDDDLDGTDAEDWAVEEDGDIVQGSGVDFPWGAGGDDDEEGT